MFMCLVFSVGSAEHKAIAMVIPTPCLFFPLKNIYTHTYFCLLTWGCSTWDFSKMVCPKILSTSAWKLCLNSAVHPCVAAVTQGSLGGWSSLELVGKWGSSASLQPGLLSGCNLPVQGLNFMRSWVFTLTWVYSSARFHFPELNSTDTSALVSFIKTSFNDQK